MVFKREVLNLVGGVIAIGLVLILAYITWALVNVTIPTGNENTLIQLVGALVANVGLIVGFFYGTSVSNKRQEEIIGTQAQTIQSAQAAIVPSEPAVNLAPGDSVKVEADGTRT